jgi:hypothetical protein
MVPPASFPTRYEAFDHQGEWCILDIATDAPRWHYSEMAVYSNRATGTHAEICKCIVPIKGHPFAADVYRNGHGDTLIARDFDHAIALASDWLGLS